MTPHLRVAIDVGPLFGHRTGVGAAVAELVGALGRRDDVVLHPYLLSSRTRPAPPTRRLPLPAAAAHRLWGRFDRPRVDRYVGDVDVIHGTNYVVPPSRRPRVVSVYDVWFLSHPDRAARAVSRAAEVLRRSVRSGAVVHASSHATAEQVRDQLETDRVEVIHLGPLPPPESPPIAPAFDGELAGRRFVLAIGTLERRKNVPALIDAFGIAARSDPDLALVLAGAAGDDVDAVTASIDRLPRDRRAAVLRVGPVSDPVKAWLLERAAVLAYPSLDEGFGFPLLEAQRAGLPIVATLAGSIPEVAGDGALLLDVGDVEGLAAGLVRATDDETLRAGLIAAGRANLTRFDWATTADAMVALYRRLQEGW